MVNVEISVQAHFNDARHLKYSEIYIYEVKTNMHSIE